MVNDTASDKARMNGTPDGGHAEDDGEVPAGPGDAGAQDAPRVLDSPRRKPSRAVSLLTWLPATGLVAIVLILVLLLAA